jgi:methionine-rich copper-binding protein CopC
MMLQIPIRRVATLFLVAAMAVLLVPGLVLAHAELETATPADKSTVTEPVAEVSGIYSEAMTPDGSSLIVKDASGATVAEGTVDPEDDTRMVATPSEPLANGTYTVESTAIATDGHTERATWTFTVAVAPTPSPTPVATTAASAAPTPTAVPATPVPSVAPTPVPSDEGSSTGSGSDALLPIIVALIILGAGAAYLLSRRARPPEPPESPEPPVPPNPT